MFFNLLKQFFSNLSKNSARNIYKYEPVEAVCGKMSSEEILKLVAPILADSNTFLKQNESIAALSSPILEENQEKNHRLWSVSLLYRQFKGKPVDESEPKVYLYLVIDDETKEIKEIYPR